MISLNHFFFFFVFLGFESYGCSFSFNYNWFSNSFFFFVSSSVVDDGSNFCGVSFSCINLYSFSCIVFLYRACKSSETVSLWRILSLYLYRMLQTTIIRIKKNKATERLRVIATGPKLLHSIGFPIKHCPEMQHPWVHSRSKEHELIVNYCAFIISISLQVSPESHLNLYGSQHPLKQSSFDWQK